MSFDNSNTLQYSVALFQHSFESAEIADRPPRYFVKHRRHLVCIEFPKLIVYRTVESKIIVKALFCFSKRIVREASTAF